MSIQIHPSRYKTLASEFEQSYFSQIKDFLISEKEAGKTVFPKWADIFKAFDLTPFDEVKVVILWQDPYHGDGQAMGLSFSVPYGVALPPSLKNIYKELEMEGYDQQQTPPNLPLTGKEKQRSGDLTKRAGQGVLLLNSILTVRAHEAASHSKIGRQYFTDAVIKKLSQEKENMVFLLRGNYAISKQSLIDTTKHLVLTGVHPSPLSAHRGRFGCNHFSLANDYLRKNAKEEIQR